MVFKKKNKVNNFFRFFDKYIDRIFSFADGS